MYHQFKKFLNNILFFLSKTELVFKFVFFCVFTHDWVKLFFTLYPPPLMYIHDFHNLTILMTNDRKVQDML